jgi:hypothetical protein
MPTAIAPAGRIANARRRPEREREGVRKLQQLGTLGSPRSLDAAFRLIHFRGAGVDPPGRASVARSWPRPRTGPDRSDRSQRVAHRRAQEPEHDRRRDHSRSQEPLRADRERARRGGHGQECGQPLGRDQERQGHVPHRRDADRDFPKVPDHREASYTTPESAVLSREIDRADAVLGVHDETRFLDSRRAYPSVRIRSVGSGGSAGERGGDQRRQSGGHRGPALTPSSAHNLRTGTPRTNCRNMRQITGHTSARIRSILGERI